MESLLEIFALLTDANFIMERGGLYLVLIILFIETGIILGFFLPGDPLLFISGMIIASATETPYPFDNHYFNLMFWEILFMASTIAGYFVGYWFGKKFSYVFSRKEETWLIKKKHIESATKFYENKGGFAITIARFLPIVRTFIPVVGGIVGMNFKLFTYYNIIGAVLWVGSIVTMGFFLGNIPFVKNNLEWIILGIILVVTLPVISQFIFKKKEKEVE